MRLDLYKTFLVAARRGTFYETADELYITPATVSKHIAALEKELGAVLFVRLPHGVMLTPEGESRLPFIRQIVETYDALLMRSEMEKEQKVVVYAAPPPSRFGLQKMLREFEAERPDIQVEIIERRGVSKYLSTGECELGFVGGKRLDPSLLQWIPVRSAKVGAVLPIDHPLAGRECISLHELHNERFIFPNPEIGVHLEYMEMCRQCGFSPEVACYGTRDDSVLFFVSCGKGVALFTKEMFDLFNYKDVVYIPLQEDFYSKGVLAKARNRSLSPSGAVFWHFVKKRFCI